MSGVRRIRTGETGVEAGAPSWVADAARHLREGGLLAYPTETVYGLGCLVREPELTRLARFKRQGEGKPFLILVRGAEDVPRLRWTPGARALAEAFWPGALTLVLRDVEGRFPERVRGESGGVAVRVSSRPEIVLLLDELRSPVTSTSANRPGERPSTSPDQVEALLEAGGPGGARGWVLLDGGTLADSPPSTIVDCTRAVPKLLRSGALPFSSITSVVPEIDDRSEV